jgi:hypothetical protein
MELLGSSYLYTLAALSVTFVGFYALVIVLRQTFGGALSKLDVLITRIFIQLGFLVAASAMLPPLFALFGLRQDLIWRTCSLCTLSRHSCSPLLIRREDGRRRASQHPLRYKLTCFFWLSRRWCLRPMALVSRLSQDRDLSPGP